MRNVLTCCGFYTAEPQPRQVIHGVGGEVLSELNRLNALEGPIRLRGVIVTFDSEAVKITLDRVCRRSGVDLLLIRPWFKHATKRASGWHHCFRSKRSSKIRRGRFC